jgi:hypothetical protein
MKKKIIHWFLDQIGVINAFERIVKLEETVVEIETSIDGLKMEADILLSKVK